MAALNSQFEDLPLHLSERVERLAAGWVAEGSSRRFWDGDESLWTSSGEANWLGWLGAAADSARLGRLAAAVRGRYSHALLLGMGGSSLCPEVLRLCFGVQDGFPDFAILDSTDPGQIADCEAAIDVESTLFLSASKSGSTLETALLTQHFLDTLAEAVGPAPVSYTHLTLPTKRIV